MSNDHSVGNEERHTGESSRRASCKGESGERSKGRSNKRHGCLHHESMKAVVEIATMEEAREGRRGGRWRAPQAAFAALDAHTTKNGEG